MGIGTTASRRTAPGTAGVVVLGVKFRLRPGLRALATGWWVIGRGEVPEYVAVWIWT